MSRESEDNHVEHIKVGGKFDIGTALLFVMVARSRGWVVTEPRDNGFGYHHVGVLSRGEDDFLDPEVEAEYQRRVDARHAAVADWRP